ncbi:complement C2 [Homo sapiens]|uniref:Complement C2 n=1 Tax=Homo sapiens TaxID=9606 RepID=F8WCJ9_HUMAN|nr:complement C2 [Homo sapiens]KAI4017687.1 complement C2 [Homo sapiens]
MGPLMVLFCLLFLYPGLADSAPSCPQNVNISGGTFTLSHGWAPGSLLTYSCPQGLYPSPASRLCKSSGQWQTPGATRSLSKAVCKREAPCGLCSGCALSSPCLL